MVYDCNIFRLIICWNDIIEDILGVNLKIKGQHERHQVFEIQKNSSSGISDSSRNPNTVRSNYEVKARGIYDKGKGNNYMSRRKDFLKNILFIYFQTEEKGRRKRGRETSVCGCLLHTCHWGPSLQLRHVPWLGTEPVSIWFAGPCSIHWTTPARAGRPFYACFVKGEIYKSDKLT